MINYIVLVLLIILAIQDFKNREISMIYIIFLAGISIVFLIYEGRLVTDLRKIMACLVVFSIVYALFKKYIGMGDLLLLMSISIYFTLEEVILLVFISSLLTSVTGMILIISRRANRNSEMPYVPFITISFLGMFLGGLI